MDAKGVVKSGLLLFVGACIGGMIVQARMPAVPAAGEGTVPGQEESRARVRVYYFHGDKRCATCNRMEEETRQALTAGFPANLRDGELVWEVRNRQGPEGRRLVEAFDLATNAVVVERLAHGQRAEWKDLKEVWKLLPDAEAFRGYIQEEVKAYLDSGRTAGDVE